MCEYTMIAISIRLQTAVCVAFFQLPDALVVIMDSSSLESQC